LLRTQPDVALVAETDALDALDTTLTATPCDVLLLDLRMERIALDVIPDLARRVKIVIVTASESFDECIAAVSAGAAAVVFKRFAVETLMQAIHAVAAGGVWLPPALQTAMAGSLRRGPRPTLTQREHEIVRYVGLGLRNRDIATRLFISERTVKTHLNNIFAKLGVHDRVELTLYALRSGIVGVHELSAS
jgi:DNA-binding NarL/FixJ family response regulator